MGFTGHQHLWTLLDGTLAHAPPGRLTFSADGLVACHLCGQWFVHLGAHLRKHDWTARDYRAAVGLARNRPLCSDVLSGQIARRQRANWCTDPDLQAAFEPGQQAARSGALAARSGRLARDRAARGDVPPEVRDRQREQLRRGRQITARARAERLASVIADSGHSDLHDYLRVTYAAGASLDQLARNTGLGRSRLRQELDAAGVTVRPTGTNCSSTDRIARTASIRRSRDVSASPTSGSG